MNQRALSILEFDKVCGLLEPYIATEIGRANGMKIGCAGTFEGACMRLQETEEADSVIRRSGSSPIDSFPDLRELLLRVHACHSLTCRELLEVRRCLYVSRRAFDTLSSFDDIPRLAVYYTGLTCKKYIEDEIARCIISEDEIADNASPELARIRRQLTLVTERIKEKLNSMIHSQSLQKHLQEPIITVRNGRYAIPVKAASRNQIPGMIHDQSASGQTLFIEPAAVAELGNELRQLQLNEIKEIDRILCGLTALVDEVSKELYTSLNALGDLDLIFAKARLAEEMHAVRPKLNEDRRLRIVDGRHPLLDRAKVVPINLWLGEDFRTLIVTGPNTGGKTVTMKTVGLFCLMAMAGLFVPADPRTELSYFDEIFADIGDEQSIEQSLSTFSSHMKNIVFILDRASENSLVLLDELGAGTDPLEGAALAQAILTKLHENGATVMATTHYSEIKTFAMTRPGMQNASMEFDVENLCPTYRLYIGIPGKSNAFEISKRIGLSEDVIDHARGFLQNRDIALEDVLAGVEKARHDAEEYRAAAAEAHRSAEAERKVYEQKLAALEAQQREIRRKAKEEAREMIQDSKKELKEIIDSLRTMKFTDSRDAERQIQKSRDALRSIQVHFDDPDLQQDPAEAVDPSGFSVGADVHIRSLNREGVISELHPVKNEALVSVGSMRMKLPLSDLVLILKDPPAKKKSGGAVKIAPVSGSMLTADLRGMTVDEGIMEIDRFIDNALLHGVKEFTVIHGKGTGALRAGIQSYLRSCPRVDTYRIGAYGEGDAGVTVVRLK